MKWFMIIYFIMADTGEQGAYIGMTDRWKSEAECVQQLEPYSDKLVDSVIREKDGKAFHYKVECIPQHEAEQRGGFYEI